MGAIGSISLSGRVRGLNHPLGSDHASPLSSSSRTHCCPHRSQRDLRLARTQPFNLGHHLTRSGRGREDVEAFGAQRRHRCSPCALVSAHGESTPPDGARLSHHRHPGSRAGRVLDPPGPAKRRDREPCRRSRLDRHVTAASAGEKGPARGGRRAKTDRIYGEALVRTLLAYKRGEPRVCAMVQAPTPQEEDRRRISRERETLTAERVQHVNRIKGLLFAQGIGDYEPLHRNRRERLEELITGDGRPLPECLKAQIRRELDRLELLIEQVKAVEAERDAVLAQAQASPGVPAPAALLLTLRGIGPEAATTLWSEGLFRTFNNRKQVAAYAGLAPTPWQSGSVHRDQGVSKAGNPRLRTIMIQIAWLWLRHQPPSALAVWYRARIKRKGGVSARRRSLL